MSLKKRTQNNSLRRIFITTGDQDGIGLEVTSKALKSLGPQPNVQFLVFRKPSERSELQRTLSHRFGIQSFGSLEDALKAPLRSKLLIEITSAETEASWVFEAARACMVLPSSALVTGPLSKTLIKDCGYAELGHTEILQSISGEKNLFMGFVGSRFSVVLATGHLPISQISPKLTSDLIERAIGSAVSLRKQLHQANSTIKILGLNPHSGEQGLIGSEEKDCIRPVLKAFQKSGIKIEGPVVPDAAFLPIQTKGNPIFVCMYHDQGLIPFKMIHGFNEGYHVTLGLPFVRTSVDHGTAKDIFGKNKANAGSMISALKGAVTLTSTKIIKSKKTRGAS